MPWWDICSCTNLLPIAEETFLYSAKADKKTWSRHLYGIYLPVTRLSYSWSLHSVLYIVGGSMMDTEERR